MTESPLLSNSPEMCEGKVYDEKSDIWALGCIVYEMACLQKTFEGSNLPALVNKVFRWQSWSFNNTLILNLEKSPQLIPRVFSSCKLKKPFPQSEHLLNRS